MTTKSIESLDCSSKTTEKDITGLDIDTREYITQLENKNKELIEKNSYLETKVQKLEKTKYSYQKVIEDVSRETRRALTELGDKDC